MDFDKLASKYQGSFAREYETHRRGQKWAAELDAVNELIRMVPAGAKALDVPVGTGRLIPVLASHSLTITGLDSSADMLAEAKDCAARVGAVVELIQGDVRDLPFPDRSFDLVTCVRFLNWIDRRGFDVVIQELSRVASDKLLVGVRYLSSLKDIKFSAQNLIPAAVRLSGVPSRPIRRWGMHIHRRRAVENLFDELGLTILEKRLIERRSDCTDYVFYLLQTNHD